MSELADNTVKSILVIESALADERVGLVLDFHKGKPRTKDWQENRDRFHILRNLVRNVIKTELEAVVKFSFDITQVGASAELRINGTLVSTQTTTSELAPFLTAVEADIQSYFESNQISGGSSIDGNYITVYAPPTWNGYELALTSAGATLEGQTKLSGGKEIGEIVSQGPLSYLSDSYNYLAEWVNKYCQDNVEFSPFFDADGCSTANERPLAYIQVGDNGTHTLVSTNGIEAANGAPIEVDDTSGDFTLVYEFFQGSPSDGASPLAKASIRPGSDASLAASWTWISGSITEGVFESDIIGSITGTGHSFEIDRATTSNLPGALTIRLTVTDTNVSEDSVPAIGKLTIATSPTAIIGTPVITDLDVTFSSNGSEGGDCSPAGILQYEWDFGDGTPIDNDPNPSHSYASIGTYLVELTVRNYCAVTATTTRVVSITEQVDIVQGNDGNSVMSPSEVLAELAGDGLVFNGVRYSNESSLEAAINAVYSPNGSYNSTTGKVDFISGTPPANVVVYSVALVSFTWSDGANTGQTATKTQIQAELATSDGMIWNNLIYNNYNAFVSAVNATTDYLFYENGDEVKIIYTGTSLGSVVSSLSTNTPSVLASVPLKLTNGGNIILTATSLNSLFSTGDGIVYDDTFFATKLEFITALEADYTGDATFNEDNARLEFTSGTPPTEISVYEPVLVDFEWADGANEGTVATKAQLEAQAITTEGLRWKGFTYNSYAGFTAAVNFDPDYLFDEDGQVVKAVYIGEGVAPLVSLVSTNPTVGSIVNPVAPNLATWQGARGWGAIADGGFRNYNNDPIPANEPEIYIVSSLSDDGTSGTLRDALSSGNRVIVFEVSGVIVQSDTSSNYWNVASDNVSVHGQTAPGDGIVVNGSIWLDGVNNFHMEHIAVMSNNRNYPDCLSMSGVDQVMINNCTFMYGYDELVEVFQGSSNITFQRCLFARPVNNSSEQAKHMIIDQVSSVAVVECAFLGGHSRTPLFWGSNFLYWANNIHYSFDDRMFQMGSEFDPAKAIVAGNVFKLKASQTLSSIYPILGRDADATWTGDEELYVYGNGLYQHGSALAIAADQTTLVGEFSGGSTLGTDGSVAAVISGRPVGESHLGTELFITDLDQVEDLLANIGARPNAQLDIQTNVKNEYTNGTGGGYPSVGDTSPVSGAIPSIGSQSITLTIPSFSVEANGYSSVANWLRGLSDALNN